MEQLMDDRHHTAIHEAGHAVIGRVLTLVCGYATIEADDDSSGHAITEDDWVTMSAWDAQGIYRGRGKDAATRGRILTFMAGREAEEECLGSCRGGDGGDRRQIDLMLDSMLPPDADLPRYAARLRSKARWLARHHRPMIERVAQLLLAHGRLEATEIDQAIAA